MKHVILQRTALMALLTVSLSGQESAHDVVPGRDFSAHRLLSPGLTDVWNLEVEKNEMLHCVVESGEFDPVLQLVDADGELLGEHDGVGTRSELWLRMPKSGDVTFRVSPYKGSGGGTYTYKLHRFRTQALANDGSAEHRFGDSRWWHYRVELEKGDVLVPHVSGHGRLVGVLDLARQGLPHHMGGYRAQTTGPVFVRIEGQPKHVCRTTLQLARQRGLDEALQLSEEVAPHGLDVWSFPVCKGRAYRLDIEMPDAQLAPDVVDPKPTRHGSCFLMPGHLDKGGQTRRYYFARWDGTLAIHLQNRNGQTASYRMRVVEENGVLPVDHVHRSELGRGEGAVYELEAESGQLLKLTLESDAFDGCLDLWGPEGNVIASLDDRSPLNRNPEHTFLIGRTGTYRLLAFSAGRAGSGAYTLRAEPLKIATLDVGSKVRLDVAHGGTSYAHLHLQQGEEVWLSVRSAEIDTRLQVLDPVGNGSFHWDQGGLGGDVLVAYRASHTGRHTLMVRSRHGSGRAELHAVRP